MTPDRWREINDLFHQAAALDEAARRELLDRAAARDPELAAEVRSLLGAHHSTGGFLEAPAWAVAPDLMFDEPGASLAGTEAGPYRILREIGRGGMGVVYEAEDTRLQRAVALKALPGEYARDAVRRERLTREARAAAALAHPSIATVYALDEYDGTLFLASELVRGETLRDEISKGPLPPERLLPTLLHIASGLAAAHRAGIVHRDLKPENMIRCADGGVKILDFGLARLPDEHRAAGARLTQTGTAVGTPGYMAPEQLAGGAVDARTDVFAFGVVAWELASGTHPFGASAAELLARMTDLLDGRPVSSIQRGLPVPGLDAVLRRCLRRDPADRYRSAVDLLEDLERLRTGSGASAALAPRADRALWWWRFHQALTAAVIASMPVVVWFLRRWDPLIGPRVFLVVLALATVAVTIRLNLLFTSRVNRPLLAAQRARVYTPLAVVETALGLVLLVAAAAVAAGPHDALAAILVTLAVAMLVSLGIIEPATTAGALRGNEEDQRVTP